MPPPLASSGETPKHCPKLSKLSAEIQTMNERKIENLTQWTTNELGVTKELLKNNIDGSDLAKEVLNFCKMDYGKAQKFAYNHFKMRCADGVVDIFHNRNSESDEILKSCQTVYLFTLPQHTKDGHKIVFMKMAPNLKNDTFDQRAFFKRFFMVSDIRCKDEDNNTGDVFILDMEGFMNHHAMKLFNGSAMTKFVKCLRNGYPRKLHAVHLIRTKQWQRSTLAIWLKMAGVSYKISSRIKTHDMEGAMDGLDLQLDQLSARLQDLNDVWTQKLIASSSWFESQEAKYRSVIPKKIKVDFSKLPKENTEDLHISNHSEIYDFTSLEGVYRKIIT